MSRPSDETVWRLALFLDLAALALLPAFAYGAARGVLMLGLLAGFGLCLAPFPAKVRGLAGQFAIMAFPVSLAVWFLGSRFHVRVPETVILAAIIALWFGGSRILRLPSRTVGWVALGLAALVPVLNLVSGLVVPKLSDQVTVTVDAVHLLLGGHNPYASSIDGLGMTLGGGPAYGGYKYSPLYLLVATVPVALFGPFSLLWINAGTLALLADATRRLVPGEHRLFALAALLALPQIGENALALGCIDLPGTALAMMAFATRERSVLLTGVLLGMSGSMKAMPALVATIALFPPRQALPYLAGVVLGALPLLVFFAWSPGAAFHNLVLFNAIRVPDDTSWRYHAPAVLAAALGPLGQVLAVLIAGGTALGNGSSERRLAAFVTATILMIASSASAHDDYMIWWMPAAIVVLALRKDQTRNSAIAAR